MDDRFPDNVWSARMAGHTVRSRKRAERIAKMHQLGMPFVFLDEFASAYLDDVLVFSSGSLAKHREHVSLVLSRLQKAGLFLDIDKCGFEVQSTKYLDFIIEAGKGVTMDPAKVQAIRDWEAPRSVKGVRAFIGIYRHLSASQIFTGVSYQTFPKLLLL